MTLAAYIHGEDFQRLHLPLGAVHGGGGADILLVNIFFKYIFADPQLIGKRISCRKRIFHELVCGSKEIWSVATK